MGLWRRLPAPVTGVFPAPLLNPSDMVRSLKITVVFFLLQPTTLACRLACLATFGFGAVLLMPGIAMIRTEENGTVHAPALLDSCGHRRLTSRVNDHANAPYWEEDGGGRTKGKNKEENFMRMLWKKTEEEEPTLSRRPCYSTFRSPVTRSELLCLSDPSSLFYTS